jgi:3-hydroxyisobutyrate dehydrogenase
MTVVGFVGTGRMGLPMCQNLLRQHVTLMVFNRTAARAEPLVSAGATIARSVAHLAAECEVVFTCLDTVDGTAEVYLGAHGIVPNAKPGTLLVDHATITPDLVWRIDAAARARDLSFLDAPVSGGPEGAQKGTLAIMAGGSMAAFERALPLLQSYGAFVRRMGDAGSGTHTKLVNQLLTFAHGMAAAEAIAMAQRTGVELEALGELLAASFGHSRMLDRTLTRVREGNYDAGAALTLFEKDLGIVAGVGEANALSLPVTQGLRERLREAMAQGLAHRDIAALRLMYPGA